MIDEGADIIDIGGESTRPGAAPVTEEEELRRVIPVIQAIRQANLSIPISVDTYRAEVARQAIEAGASLINDISAGENDKNMLPYLASNGIPAIFMHKRGNSSTMDSLSTYSDVTAEVAQYCNDRTMTVIKAGLPRWGLMVDPGLGFAKNTEQNCQLIREIPRLKELTGNMPLLVGTILYIWLMEIDGRIPQAFYRRNYGSEGGKRSCDGIGCSESVRRLWKRWTNV